MTFKFWPGITVIMTTIQQTQLRIMAQLQKYFSKIEHCTWYVLHVYVPLNKEIYLVHRVCRLNLSTWKCVWVTKWLVYLSCVIIKNICTCAGNLINKLNAYTKLYLFENLDYSAAPVERLCVFRQGLSCDLDTTCDLVTLVFKRHCHTAIHQLKQL